MSEGPYRVSNGFHGWSIQVEGSVPLIDVPDLDVATAVAAELNRLHARAAAAEKVVEAARELAIASNELHAATRTAKGPSDAQHGAIYVAEMNVCRAVAALDEKGGAS